MRSTFDTGTTLRLPALASPRSPHSPTALAGVRVADFSHFVAGPYATMLLADYGAEVIKIEKPNGGDDFRRYPPVDPRAPTQGAPFMFCNRNKRSVVLDLKTAEGLSLAKELICHSDVLVENFSTGVMQGFGLDYETCKRLNPRLIYCAIPAYGRDGPHAARAGFDAVAQAESGYIASNGDPGQAGVRSFAPIMDIATGLTACSAVLAALNARHATGVGQYCEVSLFDSALSMLGYAPSQYLLTGLPPTRSGNVSPDTSPSGVFRCSDASFYMNGGTDPIFLRLATQVLQQPSLATDARFRDLPSRVANRAALFALLQHEFEQHPWAHWRERFQQASVPSGLVKTLPEALASDEVASRGSLCRLPHPELGWVPDVRPAARLAHTPVVDPVVAPKPGEHTREVLQGVLGCTDDDLERLCAAGAFGFTEEAFGKRHEHPEGHK